MAQEIAIGAQLSGDPALIADYAGDPHLRFAIRSGLAPEGASKESHGGVRDLIKPVSLGIPYGISKYGVAAQTGKSLRWAAEVLATWRHTYPTFIKWQQDTVAQAQFDRRIVSPLGFPMAVHGDTPKRTLANYMHQASGADMMRLAAIAAREAGIHVCCPVHDAFVIMAPLNELDDAVEAMTRIMVRASAVVTGGLEIRVGKSFEVRWPDCLGDVRGEKAKGQALWAEIKGSRRAQAEEGRVRKITRLRLVGKDEDDGGSIFDDMDRLRADLASAMAAHPPSDPASLASDGKTPAARRPRETETFARIPHDRALELYRHRLNGSAWMALIELDRMIIAARGKNPVLFWSPRLRAAGLTKTTRTRALRQLEAVGVVEIMWRERGLSPLVRHRWYPRQS